MPPGNSFYIIQGEMTIILTAMRRTSRWGSHSYQDSSPEGILKDFADLKDVMNHVMNFSDLDPNTYLAPFLDVIRSEEITGPVTGLALSAVNKFLSYGLIDEKSPTAAPAVEAIADAVTHARFVGTDNASDEVVLMKILQVLRTLLLSPVGALLTNESVCEIMQSSFRICFEMRLSELLRKAAEHSLMDLVQLLFSRLRLMSEEDCSGAQTKKLRFKTGSLESRKKQKHKPKMEKEKESLPVTKMQRGVSQVPEVVKADHLPEIQARPSLVIPIVHVESPSEGSVDPGEEQPLKTPVERLAPVAASAILSTTPMPPSGKIIHMDLGSPLDSIHEDIGKDEQKEVEVEKAYSDLEGETGIPLDSSVHESGVTVSFPPEEKREYVNQQGVRFTHHLLEKPSEENAGEVALIPYGLPALRELLHFLSALINPHEKQHTDLMIHISLNLLAVALEAGAHHFHRFPSMLTLVRNDMARNLIELLATERLSMFAATLRVGFFLFESLRVHLKFQLEKYLIRLMGVIVADTPRIPYEQREVALDSIVQLWRIPGLVTELYVNYDCDLNCSNLFEDLTKLLSKNAFPVTGLYSTHLLSVDALLTVIDAIEHHCNSRMLAERHQMGATTLHSPNSPIPPPPLLRGSQQTSVEEADYRPSFPVSENIPTHEELMAVKHKKKLLAVGSEQFNIKASKGIQFMQDNMLLSNMLDPDEVALFLRDNHRLDKKMIGEYISNRKNLSILEAFVKSFDFRELRIDEALRLYLETFRLPGEAPLISLIMEHFADHWHKSNGEPFANADAAFTLAYAIIMLNVDQHNRNVKKQNNPMTVEDFKRNLKGVNGGFDFDQEMLDKIFMSIQQEEIVMPAEQTGQVKENYEWKVLLRRGVTREGQYLTAPEGLFDHDLFSLIWGPCLAALSYVFDKTLDDAIMQRTISGFRKCAMIAGHYGMSDVFDNLTISLCKFTGLLHCSEVMQSAENVAIWFGGNAKAQIAAKTLFTLAHRHGDILREGWKSLLDTHLVLYKCKLLPKCLVEAEDFVDPAGKVCLIQEELLPSAQRNESGLLSSLYSYIALSEPTGSKGPTAEDQEAMEQARDCIRDCHTEYLITESKFLRADSFQELVKALMQASLPEGGGVSLHLPTPTPVNEGSTIFFLELLIKVMIQNRDRSQLVWGSVKDHIFSVMQHGAKDELPFMVERAVVGLLRLAIRLLRREDMAPQVLESLQMLLVLKTSWLRRVSRQISFALHELLKTNAANIHEGKDWGIIFALLEVVGAGAKPVICGPVVNPFAGKERNPAPPSLAGGMTGVGFDGGEVHSECEVLAASGGGGSDISDRGYQSDSELYDTSHGGSRITGLPVLAQINRTASMDVFPTSRLHGSGGWILVSPEGEVERGSPTLDHRPLLQPVNQWTMELNSPLAFDPDVHAFMRCCESLAFLVRDVAHVTPHNFPSCVHCIRTFVEANLDGGRVVKRAVTRDGKEAKSRKRANASGRVKQDLRTQGRKAHVTQQQAAYDADESDSEELPSGYHQVAIQLLDLMHTLHTRAASIFESWAAEGSANVELESLWSTCWCPLLQGIACLCYDARKQVRTSAVTYLQRALLVHDLQTLKAWEWESCFNQVLFPLMGKLLESSTLGDPMGMEETRMRVATLLSKVFLQHLTPLLSLPTFTALWLTILDFMDKFMRSDKSDLLCEAIPESLKNMLLVMETAGVFGSPEQSQSLCSLHRNELWNITWDRISSFLPHLKEELFRPQCEVQNQVSSRHPESSQAETFVSHDVDIPPPVSMDSSSTLVEREPKELSAPEVAEIPREDIPDSNAPHDPSTVVISSLNNVQGGAEADPVESHSLLERSPPASKDARMAPMTPPMEGRLVTQGTGTAPTPPMSVPLLLNPEVIQTSALPVFSPRVYFGDSSYEKGEDIFSDSTSQTHPH